MFHTHYALASTLSEQFKTDNIIINMIIGLIIAKLIEHIFSANFDFVSYYKKFKNMFNKKTCGEIIITISQDSPDINIVILQTINEKLKENNTNITSIEYLNTGSNLNITSLNKTKIDDDIYVEITSDDLEKKSQDSITLFRYKIYSIYITSNKYKAIEIEQKLNKWIDDWEQKQNNKEPQICYNEDDSRIFKTNKTFDNLFFDGKDHLINVINRFKKGEEEYKRIGKPYTLGILLYGEAGCGKTAVLKAMAKMLSLDVHTIHIKKYKTIDDFNEVWFRSLKTECYKDLSLSEKIIHLPEIDYLSKHFLKDELIESIDSHDTVMTDKNCPIIVNIKNNSSRKKKNNDDDDDDNVGAENELSKAYFRELFDGVDEQHGRIIVMTTNNIDKLDPILIRAGRVDVKIKFEKMSNDNMKKFLKLLFNLSENNCNDFEMIVMLNNINCNKKFTPAEIQEIAEKFISNDDIITKKEKIAKCIDYINDFKFPIVTINSEDSNDNIEDE
jgi:SpoVK/Ycf46/Vps4 family AAA+-type ATPase